MSFLEAPRRHRHGVTLVEVLVVVAVIALLVGLLLPSLKAISHRSRVSADASNLRSLQQAHYQYAMESKGRFADAGLAHGGLENESIAWLNLIGEYMDLRSAVQSPLDNSPHWPTSEGGAGVPIDGSSDRFRRTSYGWNNYLSRTHSPDAAIDPDLAVDRLSRVKNPSNTVHFLHMASTGSFAGADHVHVENWWIGESHPDAPATLASNQVETHIVSGAPQSLGARSNYGFVDGHVKTLHFSEVYVRPDHNRFDPKVAGNISNYIFNQETDS